MTNWIRQSIYNSKQIVDVYRFLNWRIDKRNGTVIKLFLMSAVFVFATDKSTNKFKTLK